MAKLKDEGATSVSCACDPVMQMYLGAGGDGHRLLPRVADRRRRLHRLGPRRPDHLEERPRPVGAGLRRQSLGGPARRPSAASPTPPTARVRDDEPSLLVEELFHELLVLALGIQMAGPDLTPETFETGLFSYPGGTGQARRLGLRARPLHADHRHPRDLVGPRRGLGVQRAARDVRRQRPAVPATGHSRGRAGGVPVKQRSVVDPGRRGRRPRAGHDHVPRHRARGHRAQGRPVRLGHRPAGRRARAHVPHDAHHQLLATAPWAASVAGSPPRWPRARGGTGARRRSSAWPPAWLRAHSSSGSSSAGSPTPPGSC